MNPSQPNDRPPPPKRAPGANPGAAKPPAARPAPGKPGAALPSTPEKPAEETVPQFVVSDAPKSSSPQQPPKKKGSAKGKKGPKSPWPMIAGSAAGAIIGALVLVVIIRAMKPTPEKPRPRVTKQIKRQELPPRSVKPME